MNTARRRLAWRATSAAAAALAGLGARRLVQLAWRRSGHETGEEPDRSWAEALGWAVALGVGVGVARVVAVRGAARVWERATGEQPPEPD